MAQPRRAAAAGGTTFSVAGGAAHRIRFNSYADALRAAFLAGYLTGAGRV
jgi:O-glycosyl hydrolase